MIKLIGSC